ncbi:MAG: GGDEF domain-containing protein, partial [Pirellulales bacterium]
DHFKKLNDQHGHLAGDQVLAAIGKVLRGAVRREDAVARYGGEEFAILLPNTPLEQAVQVAQKVREAVAATLVKHNGQQFKVTMSGGLAAIGSNECAESLIQRADAALYMAKAAGRNCAFVHDGSDCRSAEDLQRQGQGPSGSAAELVELIHSADAQRESNVETAGDVEMELGSYLPREMISAELAQTCEDLRRHIEERGQCSQEAAS